MNIILQLKGQKRKQTKRKLHASLGGNSITAAQIKQDLSLNIMKRREQQILHEDGNLKYLILNLKAKPKVLTRHKTAWLNIVEMYEIPSEERKFIIFSNENCQPVTSKSYSRNYQGGSIIMWAGFGHTVKNLFHIKWI